MKTRKLWGSMICYDDFWLESKVDLQDFLDDKKIKQFIEDIQDDVILVLWGDGTMLRAIAQFNESELPFLGINFWSKGFLLNDKEFIWKNSYTKREYPLLDVYNNNEKLWVAFNDVNLYSPTASFIEFDLTINASSSMKTRWDGVVITPPGWSTWQSKGYFWPVLQHNSESMIISPKWNNPANSPKTIDLSSIIKIKNTGRLNHAAVNLDGHVAVTTEIWGTISLEIKKSIQKVVLLVADEYISKWDSKLLEEQWFFSLNN